MGWLFNKKDIEVLSGIEIALGKVFAHVVQVYRVHTFADGTLTNGKYLVLEFQNGADEIFRA